MGERTLSRTTELKDFKILAFRKDWGGHRTVIKATSADEACESYKEQCKDKFPVEWIAEVTNQ